MALTFPEILIEGVGGGLATPDYCQPPSLHQSTLIFEWFAAASKNVYTFPSRSSDVWSTPTTHNV